MPARSGVKRLPSSAVPAPLSYRRPRRGGRPAEIRRAAGQRERGSRWSRPWAGVLAETEARSPADGVARPAPAPPRTAPFPCVRAAPGPAPPGSGTDGQAGGFAREKHPQMPCAKIMLLPHGKAFTGSSPIAVISDKKTD